MDRRRRKTRDAVFAALRELLAEQDYAAITVQQIIDCADVGRTTFYANFETKDALLQQMCEEIFAHVFDASVQVGSACKPDQDARGVGDARGVRDPAGGRAPDPWNGPSQDAGDVRETIAHLLRHISENDKGVADALSGRGGELFAGYFRRRLAEEGAPALVAQGLIAAPAGVPQGFFANHFASSLFGAVQWWIARGMRETPEELAACFCRLALAEPAACVPDGSGDWARPQQSARAEPASGAPSA